MESTWKLACVAVCGHQPVSHGDKKSSWSRLNMVFDPPVVET
jgi:hypothetical protein